MTLCGARTPAWLAEKSCCSLAGALMNGGHPQYVCVQQCVGTAEVDSSGQLRGQGTKGLNAANAGSLVAVVSTFTPWDRNHDGEVRITPGVA